MEPVCIRKMYCCNSATGLVLGWKQYARIRGFMIHVCHMSETKDCWLPVECCLCEVTRLLGLSGLLRSAVIGRLSELVWLSQKSSSFHTGQTQVARHKPPCCTPWFVSCLYANPFTHKQHVPLNTSHLALLLTAHPNLSFVPLIFFRNHLSFFVTEAA